MERTSNFAQCREYSDDGIDVMDSQSDTCYHYSVSAMVVNNRWVVNDNEEKDDHGDDAGQVGPSFLLEMDLVRLFPGAENPPAVLEDNSLTIAPNESESLSDNERADAGIDVETRNRATKGQSSSDPDFEIGDHVYIWVSAFGIPAVFQHHGIVIDIWKDKDEWMIEIMDFSNFGTVDGDSNTSESSGPQSPRLSSSTKLSPGDGNHDISKLQSKQSSGLASRGPGCLRTYTTTTKNWYKVAYRAGFWQSTLSRSGTSTSAPCDAPGVVLARVYFLLNHPDVLPKYDALVANCECVAVWCKTGTWGTVQTASWLAATIAGQTKSAATLAGIAATTQVTVPASGFWGWIGYTSQVSLASTLPLLLPAIAAYGVVTVGVPTVMLIVAKSKWHEFTVYMNHKFWEDVVDHPDLFAECITHWSGLHRPSDSGR